MYVKHHIMIPRYQWISNSKQSQLSQKNKTLPPQPPSFLYSPRVESSESPWQLISLPLSISQSPKAAPSFLNTAHVWGPFPSLLPSAQTTETAVFLPYLHIIAFPCVSFCSTTKWISYLNRYIPSSLRLPLTPCPIPLL